ncbi:pyruvate kinase, partial [Candidatus Parcubacteria bacterium]|nr:pyruvate kinase [Candidatus Parcubacteria bacterium]
MTKQTKIVCTIGPACETVETLEKMVKAGMNVARLNFSHGSYDNHKKLINNIREVEKRTGEPVAIIQDLQGPKIRIGDLGEKGILLTAGEDVFFSTDMTDRQSIPIQYEHFHEYVRRGEKMLLDDGKMEVRILDVEGKKIRTKIVVGGLLLAHKGINIPESDLSQMQVLTSKDKSDVHFGVENGVDMIALSFVMKPDDILDLRFHVKQVESELDMVGNQPIRLIAKIEKPEAVERMEEIVQVVDGIMVARG